MIKLSVGQIIYLFFAENYSLTPVQVSEEVISKTLSGEKATYKVTQGKGKEQSLQELIDRGVVIYDSAASARDAMLAGSKKTIDKIVGQAISYVKTNFPNYHDKKPQPTSNPIQTLPFDMTESSPEEATPLVTKSPQSDDREYDHPVVELESGEIVKLKFGSN